MPAQPRSPLVSVARILLFELLFLTPLFFYAWASTFTMAKTTFAQLSCLALLCVLTVLWVRGYFSGPKIAARVSFVDLCVAAFGVYLAVSAIWSGNLYLSLVELGAWGTFIAVYAAARATVSTRRWLRILLGAIAISALLAAGYTLFQFYGLELPIWQELSDRMRLFSTFGNPNYLAGYLAAAIVLTTLLWLTSRRWLWLAVVAVQYTALILTETRGAWGALFVSTCLVLVLLLVYHRPFLRRCRRELLVQAAVFAAITALFLVPGGLGQERVDLSERAGSMLQSAPVNRERLLIWATAAQLIRERPVLGWGVGTYRMHHADAQEEVLWQPGNQRLLPQANRSINAHNDYLHLWAETGILGLGLFVLLVVGFYWGALRWLRRGPPARGQPNRPYVVFIVGAATSFLAHAMVSFPLHIMQNGMVWWFLVAVGVNMTASGSRKATGGAEEEAQAAVVQEKKGQRRSAWRWLLVAGVIGAAVYLGSWRVRIFSSDLHARSGRWYLRAEAIPEAEEELDRALQLNPSNFQAWADLSKVYTVRREYEKVFSAAAHARPGHDVPNLLNRKAFAYLQLGEVKEARQLLAASAHRHPNFGATYMNWGNLNFWQAEDALSEGRITRARSLLNEAFACYSQAQVWSRKYAIPRSLSLRYLELAHREDTRAEGQGESLTQDAFSIPFHFYCRKAPGLWLAPPVYSDALGSWVGVFVYPGEGRGGTTAEYRLRLIVLAGERMVLQRETEIEMEAPGAGTVITLYLGTAMLGEAGTVRVRIMRGDELVAEEASELLSFR